MEKMLSVIKNVNMSHMFRDQSNNDKDLKNVNVDNGQRN